MKRGIYISLFVILGLVLQLLLHSLLEGWYIKLLLVDFDQYSFGLSWRDWFVIHKVAAIFLTAIGAGTGYWMGRYCWPKLYDEGGHLRKHWLGK